MIPSGPDSLYTPPAKPSYPHCFKDERAEKPLRDRSPCTLQQRTDTDSRDSLLGTVVRRLRAGFSGSPGVGNGLDGELARLVPQAGLTSAQTDSVIPAGTTVSSRSRSLKAEFRRHTTVPKSTTVYPTHEKTIPGPT